MCFYFVPKNLFLHTISWGGTCMSDYKIVIDAGHGGIAYTKWGYIWFNAR